MTVLLCISLPALADPPPLPQSKQQALDSVQSDLDQEKREQQAAQKKLAGIERELEDTRSKLVTLADDVRKNEQELERLENRIAELSKEEKTLSASLEEDYGSIANLILALERMRRIPPESLIVRPGAPLDTAQSAMLLKSALPAVSGRAERLSMDLERLKEIEAQLNADRGNAIARRKELEGQLGSVQALVSKREKLYSGTKSDFMRHKNEVARLSREAKTLMDLIDRLETERQRRQEGGRPVYHAALPETGNARAPVMGAITEVYGQRNAIGAVSQGISIESRPGSLVVAPMGGVVRFARPFKNYGNMVIIEHKDGYHSLIGGLHKIDISEESAVKPGEPIGQLPLNTSRGGNPALYYELRYKGKPVDPVKSFPGLRS